MDYPDTTRLRIRLTSVVKLGIQVLGLDRDIDLGGMFVASLTRRDDSKIGSYLVLAFSAPTLFE